MNKFFMVIGLPASGKSTYAKELAVKDNAIIHASDELRKELFGNTNDNTQNDKLFMELHKRIRVDLKAGKNVIYDATNIHYKRRMAFLQEIKNIPCEKIAVVIATPYEDCLAQNKTRERQVPEHVIKRMYKNFYIPQKYEGFNDIQIVWNDKRKREYIITELLHRLKDIDQENNHHTLTIGDHCVKCVKIIEQQHNNINLSYAALLHDIGKEFTKEFKNSKGEDTAEAHFYQHHLVSAYDSMFYLKNIQNVNFNLLKTIALITWHMHPFNNISNKFIKMVGQDFYNDLMILHEADKMAK